MCRIFRKNSKYFYKNNKSIKKNFGKIPSISTKITKISKHCDKNCYKIRSLARTKVDFTLLTNY